MGQSITSPTTQLPSIIEDFEVGDRVFQRRKDSIPGLFGEVVGVADNMMLVMPEGLSGRPKMIEKDCWEEDPYHISHWGKMPDDRLIEVGDVMSTMHSEYLSKPGNREFFTVTVIVPSGKIVLESLTGGKHILEFNKQIVEQDGYRYASLSQYLQHWELEG